MNGAVTDGIFWLGFLSGLSASVLLWLAIGWVIHSLDKPRNRGTMT